MGEKIFRFVPESPVRRGEKLGKPHLILAFFRIGAPMDSEIRGHAPMGDLECAPLGGASHFWEPKVLKVGNKCNSIFKILMNDKRGRF